MTLRLCPDQLIAKGEGVLVKGSSEYLNALMLNTVSETAEANNDLVARTVPRSVGLLSLEVLSRMGLPLLFLSMLVSV